MRRAIPILAALIGLSLVVGRSAARPLPVPVVQSVPAHGVPRAYTLAWDAPVDAEGRLLPAAVAGAEHWREVVAGYGQTVAAGVLSGGSPTPDEGIVISPTVVAPPVYDKVLAAVAMDERRVAVWTAGGDLRVMALGDDGRWGTVAATGPISSTSFTLFLAGGGLPVVADGDAGDWCTDGGDWVACDAGDYPDRTDVRVTFDGRWLYAAEGHVYDVGWTTAQATTDQPLTVWQEAQVEVAEGAPYHLRVATVYGDVRVDTNSAGPGVFDLGEAGDDLVVTYAGAAPARVTLSWTPRTMAVVSVAPDEAGRMTVTYEPAGQVIAGGATYRSDVVNVAVGGAMKATRVCAEWGGGDLTVNLLEPGSGQVLGYTTLPAGRECNLVYGGVVNRAFVAAVSGGEQAVQLYGLQVRLAY